jgi:Ca2+-binding EF-hand superfamily protein
MRRVLALTFTVAMLPLGSHEADAQALRSQAPTRQNTEMRFRGMDRNGDGVITRGEWNGSAQSFNAHDWNRDGVLSGDEVRVGAPRNDRRLSDDDFDPASDQFNNWTAENFTFIDRNRDGRVRLNEWAFDAESFRRVDRNGDGALTQAEFLGSGAIDDDRDDRFEYLDADGNGRVERREWHGSGETFEWLDRNRDDVLTRAEVVGGQAAVNANTAATGPGANDRFGRIDFNGNGRIDRDEWQWNRRGFDERDANQDGVLSQDEFNAALAAAPAAGRRGAVATSGQIVRVQAKQRWTDTGLDVQAGDRVTFDAEGTMQLSEGGTDAATPAGARSGRRAPNAPLAEEVAGGLIARIGESTPIFVGAQRTIQRAPLSGRLFLAVNDDHLDDNTGEYRVSITIDRR